MARFWSGNPDPQLIDPTMVGALRQLDDSFHVLLETDFDARNADVTILRASDDREQPSTLIVTEVKHFNLPVRGTTNGPWEHEVARDVWEPIPCRGRDISPYRQAVNTADAIHDWLYNHQRLFLDNPGQLFPDSDFRVWPDLLLLSPPAVRHQLPLRMPHNFGCWFDSLDAWVRQLNRWAPKQGIGLAAHEIEAIVTTLRLAPYQPAVERLMPRPQVIASTPVDLSARLQRLEAQIARFQQEVTLLRSALTEHAIA